MSLHVRLKNPKDRPMPDPGAPDARSDEPIVTVSGNQEFPLEWVIPNANPSVTITLPECSGYIIKEQDYRDLQEMLTWWRRNRST